jgi:hypothetical protein
LYVGSFFAILGVVALYFVKLHRPSIGSDAVVIRESSAPAT